MVITSLAEVSKVTLLTNVTCNKQALTYVLHYFQFIFAILD